MGYDAGLAQRIRDLLVEEHGITEKKMFGGLAFMLHGHMFCGPERDRLMVRVGAEAHEEALRQPHARPMDFTGKPMRGFVYVDQEGFAEDDDLAAWIERGLAFVRTLPPK